MTSRSRRWSGLTLAVACLALFGACRFAARPRGAAAPLGLPAAKAAPVRAKARLAYGGRIDGPTDPSPFLQSATGDTIQHLEAITGKPVVAATGSSDRGIILVRTSGPVQPGEAERLQGRGPEAFLITSQDDRTLRIVANTDAGLAWGLYRYLHELGFRWLLPGRAWEITPTREDTAVRIDRIVEPAFRARHFFGTGRFGPPTPVAPGGEVQKLWDTWSQRNGFGGEFFLSGHAGEGFAQRHRAELEAHPEYLALSGGKRVPWALSARYCVSNPGLQRLFIEDRLAQLSDTIRKYPDSPYAFAVSVEPADGEGRCECDRCRAIGQGTEEDQIFFLANQVGAALRARLPGHYANLMAYGRHAAPPSIPIDPNVYVTVAPEGFQRTGLGHEAFIRAWHERVSRLSLYTYWSIPDWSFDQPSFNFRYVPALRIPAWKTGGIEGVMFETSFGAGASGIGLYVASRLLWEPERDVGAILDEFYALAFEEAEGPMRRLLERWATQFTSSAYELGASYQDLAAARRAAGGNRRVLSRLRDYEIYMHFLRLWAEQRGQPKDQARLRALITWLYRADSTAMVASYRLRTLLLERFSRDPVVSGEFDLKAPGAPGWVKAKAPIGDGELAALMSDGARSYPPPSVQAKTYAYRLVPPAQRPPELPDEGRSLNMITPTDFELEVVAGRPLVLDVTIRLHPTIPFESVTVRAEDGTTVYDQRHPADGVPRRISLALPGGRYICHVEDQKATFSVRAPRGTRMVMRQLTSVDPSPRVYFWVPRGVSELAMLVPPGSRVDLFDPEGRPVDAPKTGLVVARVPEGQGGRAWSLRGYKAYQTLRMINLPQVFALSPDALLVPEDAAGAP